jgi:BON domain
MNFSLFALLLTCLAALAQTRPATPKTSASHTRPAASTARPRVSDAEIEQTIRAKFAKSKISADKFTVKVQGGIATIEGRSDVVQHKGTATRLAKTGGAVAVVNKIQLSQAAKDKAAKNLEKGRRRAQVKRGDARSDARTDPRSAK